MRWQVVAAFTVAPLVVCWRHSRSEQEDAMNMRGPGGIIGVIVAIILIFIVLRLLGLI